jgi:outer membrane lipoprotein LolB
VSTALRVGLSGSVALLVLLAGCRTAPAPAVIVGPGADAPWSEQRAGLEKLASYSLTGRVAVAANGQGFSGNLRYRQQAQRADVALDGPLGMGGLHMALDGERLSVSTSKGEQLDGPEARAELERRLGFELPLDQLRWWLLGIPAPGESVLDQDAGSGEIRGFQQKGWRVNIDTRFPALGFALPQKLTATHEGARLKMLIESWQP